MKIVMTVVCSAALVFGISGLTLTAQRGGAPLTPEQEKERAARAAATIKANKFSIYGVEIGSVQKMQENGRKLAEYRATITLNALKKAQAEFVVP